MDLTTLFIYRTDIEQVDNLKAFNKFDTMKFGGFMKILDEFNRTQSSNWTIKLSRAVENKEVDRPPNEDDLVNDCQCRMCLDAGKFYVTIVSSLTKMVDSAPFEKASRFKIPQPGHARNNIIESSYWKKRIDAIEQHQKLDSKFIRARFQEMFPIDNFVTPIVRMRRLMSRLQVELEERNRQIRLHQNAIEMERINDIYHYSRSYEN
ncbi:uncharacterized protein LOC143917346 [Arctopsyche grandis]|uniref:uncharacterized protein LOC143917346 n=1 Tax=Arctopsyche grandis TaxID=121162 RepID=UPI00406D8498